MVKEIFSKRIKIIEKQLVYICRNSTEWRCGSLRTVIQMVGRHVFTGGGWCSGRESIADGDECRKRQQDSCKEIRIHCDEV